jgi:hypothetical protein
MTWRRSDPSDPEGRKRGVTKDALITKKVCLKSLPGGSWGRLCKRPPRMTGATPPLLRHTRGARPKTAPPAHRQERRRDPMSHGSGTGATSAAPRSSTAQGPGCRSAGRAAFPPPPSEAPSADASAISASAATGRSPTGTAAASAAAGANAGSMSGGPKATSTPAASPSTTATSTEEPASGTHSTATGAA